MPAYDLSPGRRRVHRKKRVVGRKDVAIDCTDLMTEEELQGYLMAECIAPPSPREPAAEERAVAPPAEELPAEPSPPGATATPVKSPDQGQYTTMVSEGNVAGASPSKRKIRRKRDPGNRKDVEVLVNDLPFDEEALPCV
jgi:hypothetical protein